MEEGGSEEEHVIGQDTYEGAEFVEGDMWEEVACIVQRLLLTPKSQTTLNDIKYSGLNALFVI